MIPDYKQIYTDIIQERFPEKLTDTAIRHKLERLNSAIEVLKFNQLIFGEPDYAVGFNNQRLRSYDEDSVLEILRYQKKNGLNNIQLSHHFKISRNTITKWKAIFKV
ncbi:MULTISPECIES: helix-turn-helix domain-containing protein [Chryseobacterium]|uniref:Helix-turn-helix domain-containing protein n=2 Tax=Chryseobacterium bernardetii TaxID=1241978 RepID=A0A3G6T4S5_9FLAO|nr:MULTISPECIES: helix-turn-helix domain-containing protein [Chryseobacterium]AZB24355.1 helix-turn-helix domain-containing protein [Chryseobacterium bernardetii]AZB34940.1 helix-turn-helix domain-containing protein [Chryseobacterium bernardetii]UCA58775.1 helix-turn-helix domain-containing protein [Chryseobacterium rhizoplanae]